MRKIYKIIIISIIILLPLTVISINENMKERMFNQVLISLGVFEDIPATSNHSRQVKCCQIPKHLFSLGHSKHYEVGIRMFLDKPLLGHGLKSFRYKCHDFQVDIGCGSHPHNTYVQLLAESGVFSFLIVFILFLYFCYLMIKNYLNRISINKNIYNARVCIIGSFIMNLFPLVPTGSFFTNWLCILYFLPLGILFYLYDYPLYEKKSKIAVIIPCFKVKGKILKVVKMCVNCFDFIVCIDDKCPENSGLYIKDNFKKNKRLKLFFIKKIKE